MAKTLTRNLDPTRPSPSSRFSNSLGKRYLIPITNRFYGIFAPPRSTQSRSLKVWSLKTNYPDRSEDYRVRGNGHRVTRRFADAPPTAPSFASRLNPERLSQQRQVYFVAKFPTSKPPAGKLRGGRTLFPVPYPGHCLDYPRPSKHTSRQSSGEGQSPNRPMASGENPLISVAPLAPASCNDILSPIALVTTVRHIRPVRVKSTTRPSPRRA